MKITRIEMLSMEETFSRLKKTRLRGFDQAEVYKDASFALVHECYANKLFPSQRYVIASGVNKILEIADAFQEQYGLDAFHLKGAVLFWPEGATEPIPFLPPLVEESREEGYSSPIWIINDGMHRVYAARKCGMSINVILVKEVPNCYPYYAFPLPEQWGAVYKVEEVPQSDRKAYRNPDDYKALFRDFNAVFDGIQKKRV